MDRFPVEGRPPAQGSSVKRSIPGGSIVAKNGAVVLRKSLLVSTDDLLAVVREFLNPEVSRSGLDRCLRRHGAGNLRDLQAQSPRPKHKACKTAHLDCEDGKDAPADRANRRNGISGKRLKSRDGELPYRRAT